MIIKRLKCTVNVTRTTATFFLKSRPCWFGSKCVLLFGVVPVKIKAVF